MDNDKASEVSFVVSCSYILSMIPDHLLVIYVDRYDKKKVNMILLVISSIFGFSYILVHNIYLIAIVYSVVLALLNGINPIIERMVTVSKHKYGFILCC